VARRVEALGVRGQSLKMIELWPFNETKVLYPSPGVCYNIPTIICPYTQVVNRRGDGATVYDSVDTIFSDKTIPR